MFDIDTALLQLRSWATTAKRKVGFYLIRKGVGLAFYTKNPHCLVGSSHIDQEVLGAMKDEANRSTLLGSQIETGNHAHGHVQPVSNYTAVGVVCALRDMDTAIEKGEKDRVTIDDETYKYYVEHWKY